MQDVYLDQDVLDRVFGLWDLHISSATESSGIEAHIDGVSRENALLLREILMKALLPDKSAPSEAGTEAGVQTQQTGGKTLKEFRPSSTGMFSVVISALFAFAVTLIWLGGLLPLAILIGVATLIWQYLDFTVLRYELREDGVFIRSGFISRSESLFLYKNIQDAEEIATIWDRILGLKSLSIKTMTANSTVAARMLYLNAEVAPALREEIISLAKKESQKAEKRAKAEKAPLMSIAKGIPALAIEADKDFERPKIEEKEFPYKNNFYKGALYTVLIYGGILWVLSILLALILLAFGQMGLAGLGIVILVILTIVGIAATYLGAFLSAISYRYTISSDFVLIKTGILNILKKQINYGKMQDLEKKVGFSQSFAGLATLKLETGSRESAGNGRAASAVTQNEIIPDLNSGDAETLRHTILSQMGLSYKGIGTSPLVFRIPLEAIKPLKKTFWWIFYSLVVLVIATGALLLFARGVFWLDFVLFAFLASICSLKYIYEYYYYKRYFYDLNDDMLVIRKGVFGSRELMIPFEKIQDVFVDRDWLDLAFGLYDVYVTTVSSRSILNAHIDGLNEKNAGQAAELLLKKIKA